MSNHYGSLEETDLLLESGATSHDTYPKLSSPMHSPSIAKPPYRRVATFLIFIFPALGGLLFGYDIGGTSAVVSQLKSETYAGVAWSSNVANSSLLQGTITSLGMFGAMLGSLVCFQVADDLGRRRTLIIASFLYVIGSMAQAMSGDASYSASVGITLLIIGRVIYGTGCGFAMHGAPAYIGEMAPSQIRGLLVSLKEGFIVLGMVFGYTIGYIYSGTDGGWRWTYGWALPFALIMMLGMFYLPYSARWLALKGRLNEARLSLMFVTPNVSDADVDSMNEVAQRAADSQKQAAKSTGWYDPRMLGPTIFPALVAGVGLVFLQQVTGQPSVLYYADSIFEDVGLDTMASILLSLFKLAATLFTTFTVDNYGRKYLLFVGCGLMLSALIVLVIAFLFPYTSASDCYSYSTDSTCPSTCTWSTSCSGYDSCTSAGYTDDDCTCCDVGGLNAQKSIILLALFVYIGGYQVGFGPISWLMISEIFPLEVRGKAVSIAVVTNFFWNTLMSFSFAIELDLIGVSWTFFIYAVILTFGIYFIYERVPETKGLTLEQIEEYFLRTSKGDYQAVKNSIPEEDENIIE